MYIEQCHTNRMLWRSRICLIIIFYVHCTKRLLPERQCPLDIKYRSCFMSFFWNRNEQCLYYRLFMAWYYQLVSNRGFHMPNKHRTLNERKIYLNLSAFTLCLMWTLSTGSQTNVGHDVSRNVSHFMRLDFSSNIAWKRCFLKTR